MLVTMRWALFSDSPRGNPAGLLGEMVMASIQITQFPDWDIEGGGWLDCPLWSSQSLDMKFDAPLPGSDVQVGWYEPRDAEELPRG